jgi:hypothetical protein
MGVEMIGFAEIEWEFRSSVGAKQLVHLRSVLVTQGA